MESVKVTLQPCEYEVLSQLCRNDIRSLAGQLRYLLHEEAQRRGLWPKAPEAKPRKVEARHE